MVRPRRGTPRSSPLPGPRRGSANGVRRLGADDVADLPPCGPPCPLAAVGATALRAAVLEGSVTGHVLHEVDADGSTYRLVGAVLLLTPELAATGAWTPGGVSPDALAVLALRRPDARPVPAGRLLVRAAAADLLRVPHGGTRVRALESWATGTDPCRPGIGDWAELGFSVHRAHPAHPRVRLDLGALATWRAGAAGAWGRLSAPAGRRAGRARPAAGEAT
ncbi:MAG: hypothetical protein Q8Q02_17205 [Nocardioides sp.]|nr:hypothetical protein [Nocardioides sp.]